MNSKKWLFVNLILTVLLLAFCAYKVIDVDPFFHYHKPLTDKYYYTLTNQRSINDGIVKHFDFDAIITGTSMTENFKSSEVDELFGVNSVKVPFSGATFKETADLINAAYDTGHELKLVIRGLDYWSFADDKDKLREDLGQYPDYLYDKNPFNDTKYIFNRDVLFGRIYSMEKARLSGSFEPGITSFDDYSNWSDSVEYGPDAVFANKSYEYTLTDETEFYHLTDEEIENVYENIRQNVTSIANSHPETEFYCFFPPFSVVWWREQTENGYIYTYYEAEKITIEELLKCSNIKLFAFNEHTEVTTNLDNYRDTHHYGGWINSQILEWMKEGEGLITKDNYLERLDNIYDFYLNYDYESLMAQTDFFEKWEKDHPEVSAQPQ